MTKSVNSSASRRGISRRTFSSGVAAAGIIAGTAPFNIVRAQGTSLKVGVLLPRSGVQAGIGQDCHRGVEVTAVNSAPIAADANTRAMGSPAGIRRPPISTSRTAVRAKPQSGAALRDHPTKIGSSSVEP